MAARREGDWVENQQKAFTRWVNDKLKDRGMHVNDLCKDLSNGVILINLLEELSGKSLGKYNKNPTISMQKMENLTQALKFIEQEGIKTVNIGPQDIAEGRQKLVLGLIWTLILRYQIASQDPNKGTSTTGANGSKGSEESQAKKELLEWVRGKIPDYNIRGFGFKDWGDGRAICGLVNAMDPTLCTTHSRLDSSNGVENAACGTRVANQRLGIPVIVEPEEMASPSCDELGMATYISIFRDLERRGKIPKRKPAADEDDSNVNCRMRVTPAGECDLGQNCEFDIDGITGGRILEVSVEGPRTTAKPIVTKSSDGSSYHVKFTPTEAGQWLVHCSVNKKPIKGSPFSVTVKEPPKKKVQTTTTTYTTLYKKGTHCGKCGTKLDPVAKYCGVCGEPAYDAKRRCPNRNCREFLDDIVKICPKCGAECS